MVIPRDIGRPPNAEDGECLFRMPEVRRDLCEGAVRAGFARSPEEYWYYELKTTTPNLRAARTLFLSLIRAAGSERSETRNEAQRLDDALTAVFGRSAGRGSNAKDDVTTLAKIAMRVEWFEEDRGKPFDESALRGVVREALEGQNIGATELESVVRRLVQKYRADPLEAASIGRGMDHLPEKLEESTLREVAVLLHSIGVPTDLLGESM